MRTKVQNDRTRSKQRPNRSSIPGQNQPKPAKKPGTRIPPPQAARIVSRFIAGESIREIARAERRDRSTIARVVRCGDVQAYISGIRGEYLGLGPVAITAVERGLRNSKDGRLARQVLDDIGVLPRERERYRLLSSDSQSGNRELDERKEILEWVHELRKKVRDRTRR
jgi:hypothetical protein